MWYYILRLIDQKEDIEFVVSEFKNEDNAQILEFMCMSRIVLMICKLSLMLFYAGVEEYKPYYLS